MKKILALVLAVAMMSTMAFAAADLTLAAGTSAVNPGETLYIPHGLFDGPGSANLGSDLYDGGDFNKTNFGIYKKSFSKGGNLVKSVTINDNESRIDIVLNQDYEMTRPTSNNLIIDTIQVRALRNIDSNGDNRNEVTRSTIYTADPTAYTKALKVGYDVGTPVDLNVSPLRYTNGSITRFKKAGDPPVVYGTASLSSGDLYIEGRVYDGDKIYVAINNNVKDDQKAALKAYPDADLRFVNLIVNNLSSNNTVNLLAAEDEFVYEISGGKVVKSSLKWSDEEYAWVGKVRASKNYVISDIELKVGAASTDSADTTNPETGANDVVGVAAALAVISLVAAGAVSLKK